MPKVTVTRGSARRELKFEGTPVLGVLLAQCGLGVSQPCGGRGVCGKCAVEAGGRLSEPSEAELRAGTRLACQTRLLGDCEVTLPQEQGGVSIETEGAARPDDGAGRAPMAGDFGAAVDIGTTTVVLSLFDLRAGVCLARQAAMNPQTQVSADVIGRIGAAMGGRGDELRDSVQACVLSLLAKSCGAAEIAQAQVSSLVLTGNTTMLYLLTGRDPEPLSHAPFHADTLFGQTAALLGRTAYLPPCMDAFVGADVTCAVLSAGLCQRTETALLMDVGTNGEIALWHGGKLYVASTAAGPAFEGVGISCGCGSVTGAIDRVWAEGGALGVHTIGGGAPVGVCGSGLIDAVATMLELSWIDDTGAMDADDAPLAPGIALTRRDVRSVQLAKGAIAAGVLTMLRTAGIAPADVATLYIAGGFGSHLNVRSAAAIGLIPRELAGRVKVMGNGALAGAEALLLNRDAWALAEGIARQAHTVALGGNPVFSELYLDCMRFYGTCRET